MTTRTTVMRVRLDLAVKMNPADMTDVLAAAEKIEALKKSASDIGFIFTADVIAKIGTVAVDEAVETEAET